MTRQHSIVNHKGNYFFRILEDDYLLLYQELAEQLDPIKKETGKKPSGSPDCKAMIASILEGWMNSKRPKARTEDELCVYYTIDDWLLELRHHYGRSVVIQCLKEMEEEGSFTDTQGKYGEKGMIYTGTVVKLPYIQNTFMYRLNLPVIQELLNVLPDQSPFEQKPHPMLGRPKKSSTKINGINLNGIILDFGSTEIDFQSPKVDDGSLKKDAPFYTQIHQELPQIPTDLEEDASASSPAQIDENEPDHLHGMDNFYQQQYHLEDIQETRSDIEELMHITDKHKAVTVATSEKGHDNATLHASSHLSADVDASGQLRTASGADLPPRSATLAIPVAVDSARGAATQSEGDANGQVAQQQTPSQPVSRNAVAASPSPVARSFPPSSDRPTQRAVGAAQPELMPGQAETVPKRRGKSKDVPQEVIPAIPAEALRILDDWDKTFKSPVARTEKLLKAAIALIPCKPTMENLRDCKNWLFTTDNPQKPWFRKKGVSLQDVAEHYGEWQSVREPPQTTQPERRNFTGSGKQLREKLAAQAGK